MKRKIYLSLFLLVSALAIIPFFTSADSKGTSWIKRWSTPSAVVNSVADLANQSPATKIQDTKLNKINNNPINSQSRGPRYQISNTLIRLATDTNWITNYIQRAVFIWLVVATILLIWNWFKLVTWNKPNETKDSIKYILIWVVLLVWFYAVISIVTALINYFFAG